LIATKLTYDDPQVGLHPGCAQGQGGGQRSYDMGSFVIYKNRFFSQANDWITTKLAHDRSQLGQHLGCAQTQGQGQGQRSLDVGTFVISQKITFSPRQKHWIAIKLPRDGPHVGMHAGCAQIRGQSSCDMDTCDFTKNRFFFQEMAGS